MDISLDAILYVCGAIASIAGAAAILNKLLKKTIENTTKDSISKEMDKNQEKLNCQINEIKCALDNYIQSNNDANEIVKSSLLSITRDRINQAHAFYMQNNFIGTYSLSVLEDLFASYQKLGGNSFISKEMQDLRELEVISTEEIIKTGNQRGKGGDNND